VDRRCLPSRRAGPIYLLRLKARPGSSGLGGLRRLLKHLGRYHNLVCIGAREVRAKPPPARIKP
jgi:hypothetical protein